MSVNGIGWVQTSCSSCIIFGTYSHTRKPTKVPPIYHPQLMIDHFAFTWSLSPTSGCAMRPGWICDCSCRRRSERNRDMCIESTRIRCGLRKGQPVYYTMTNNLISLQYCHLLVKWWSVTCSRFLRMCIHVMLRRIAFFVVL